MLPVDKIILQECMRYVSGDNTLHRKILNLLLPRFVLMDFWLIEKH